MINIYIIIMIKIYCIIDINGLRYVGSTKKKLSYRLSNHKSQKDCSSKLLNLNDCRIILLEECEECDRKVREQYWIDKIDCVNIVNTIPQDKKEYDRKHYLLNKKHYDMYRNNWAKNNPKSRKKTNKKYRETHKEQEKIRQQKYTEYRNSWGGDMRSNNNNLLKIDVNLFTRV